MPKAKSSQLEIEYSEKTLGVSQYISELNSIFSELRARIVGEISQLKVADSGHVYFTVKDKAEGGVLDCIIWRGNYAMCGIELEVGMEIILSGKPSIYPQSGRFSFVADTVELVGEGALKKQYDELKNRLEKEGLFKEERKRVLPEFPEKIGIITSLKGAVIHDFMNNLGKFGFKVKVMDARVEGQQAVISLTNSMDAMSKQDIDVLVVIRGGGSLESLQAFNNEALIRKAIEFPVPVIAGIGHDQDVPLFALAADHMVSTPTAAAHLVSRSWIDAMSQVRNLSRFFSDFWVAVKRVESEIRTHWVNIERSMERELRTAKEALNLATSTIRLNDPKRQLKLGYSIARHNGKLVRNVGDLKIGDLLELQINDGQINTEIKEIK